MTPDIQQNGPVTPSKPAEKSSTPVLLLLKALVIEIIAKVVARIIWPD